MKPNFPLPSGGVQVLWRRLVFQALRNSKLPLAPKGSRSCELLRIELPDLNIPSGSAGGEAVSGG
ncbi:hypothetical protein [Glycomyces sp. MUSA5-2]|uniref:hypothetical protein n=1 Tax=Glycomyces sp. MUSA5-2 TaxID=2053002 RepID=UPI003009ED6A